MEKEKEKENNPNKSINTKNSCSFKTDKIYTITSKEKILKKPKKILLKKFRFFFYLHK
jgi:hypothetical protein